MSIVFELNARRVRHVLVSRKGDRIAAIVAGRALPTRETEEGRVAVLPNGALPWAQKMGLRVYSPTSLTQA